VLSKALIAALLVGASPHHAPAPPARVRSLVEAEWAFARMAQEKGSAAAFRTWIAEDGQMFLPGPTRARPLLAAGKIDLPPIRWWPILAGVAASGDLGFTAGPAVAGEGDEKTHGFFFTIWRRRAGTWRWILDKGTPQAAASDSGSNVPIQALAPGRAVPRAGADSAWRKLREAETALANGLASDAPAAFRSSLAPDGWLIRAGVTPGAGPVAVQRALAAAPLNLRTATVGGGISRAGDLAYTYGTAVWTDGGAMRNGYYLRVWQHRTGGWTLVVDQTTGSPQTARTDPPASSAKPLSDATKPGAKAAD
jgi:hypothetical protein